MVEFPDSEGCSETTLDECKGASSSRCGPRSSRAGSFSTNDVLVGAEAAGASTDVFAGGGGTRGFAKGSAGADAFTGNDAGAFKGARGVSFIGVCFYFL